MGKITLEQIKRLRIKTKAGVMDCRQALEECGGDLKKAEAWLLKKGKAKAAKRADRETSQGIIQAYTHGDGRIVAVVELLCETDFVAKNEDFRKLARELAMQVAAMNPADAKTLLKQNWIRDESRNIDGLVKETIGTTGENIKIGRIARFELGQK